MAKSCCGHQTETCCDSNILESKDSSSCGASDAYPVIPMDEIPIISSALNFQDRLGAVRVRLGFNRSGYKVAPGLYRIGNPDVASPVLVTANYKLTFDSLRKELADFSAWILVLDTKGVNVWCAAGKGTFGTAELLRQIRISNLEEVVSHRNLILPQLGAPGVSAHEIARQSGFKVIYGPVKASDLPAFLRAGLMKTQKMRTVEFSLLDRLILTPAELSYISKPIFIFIGIAIVLWLAGVESALFGGVLPYIGAVLLGNFLVPALLPWIPGAAFSFKGWFIGSIFALILFIAQTEADWQLLLTYLLILPPLTAYIAMNFTGSSTYTSLAGVLKETRIALPLILTSLGAGLLFTAIRIFLLYYGGV